MKNKLLLWLVLLLPQFFKGQTDGPFQTLNLNNCSSGILIDKVQNPVQQPPENKFSKSMSEAWWNQLKRATLDGASSLFSDQQEVLENLESYGTEQQVLAIALADVVFHEISNQALNDGDIVFDGTYFVQEDNNQNVFEKQKIAFPICPIERLHKFHYDFEFVSSLSVTNRGPWSNYIEIDADDGLGMRTVAWDSPFEITYAEIYTDKNITIRWRKQGEEVETKMILKGEMCESHFDSPDAHVPWPEAIQARNPSESWRIKAQGPHGPVYGNAYYLPRGDFDKPFVFVEGIDFDRTQGPLQNGSFGWCQFTSGSTDPNFEYNFISEMPSMLQELIAHGYDIILLDFEDGAYWLEDNGQLLIELITLINDNKQGSNELVLAGASMGGVIARYALAYMEQHGMKHCTRTFLSLDAPHKGAYVPVGLQQMLHMLSDESAAQDFIHNNLERPAARQMLVAQAHSYTQETNLFADAEHEQWQSYFESLGFPQKCRCIGIANGNLNGLPNCANAYDPMMDQSCELTPCSIGPEVKFYITSSAGNPWYNFYDGMSTDEHVLSAQLVRSADVTWVQATHGFVGGIFGWVAAMICEVNKNVKNAYVLPNTPNYDYAPGGTRTSIHEFANAINSTNSLTNAGCEHLHEYRMEHAFVHTTSALNLNAPNPNVSAAEWIATHPTDLAFDAIYAPLTENERHSSLNNLNRTFILEQVLGGEDSQGNPLIPIVFSNETSTYSEFNFGKSTFNYLSNTTVGSGKSILINKYNHLHYGNEDLPEMGSHFVCHLRGNCNSNNAVVASGGLLAVGDELNQTTAELRLHEGSNLVVGDGGTLIIQSGSTLRVKSGARLILEDGAKLIIRDETNVITRILIEPGGVLQMGNSTIYLQGDKSRIELSGGEIVVNEGSMANILPECAAGGQLVCNHDTYSSAFLHSNSKLYVNGSNSSDPLWHMQANSQFEVSGNGGQLRLSRGMLIQNSQSTFTSNQNALIIECALVPEFENSENASLVSNHSTLRVSNCKVRRIQIVGNGSQFSAFRSQFTELPTIVSLENSDYEIRDCYFIDAGLQSAGTSTDNHIYSTSFSSSESLIHTINYINDQGLNSLFIQNCNFAGGKSGVEKNNGEATLRCSNFEQNVAGLILSNRAKGVLSAGEAGGYNHFAGSRTHIKLQFASYLNMMNGFNTFSEASEACISGTIFGTCASGCNATSLTTSRNVWPYYLTQGMGPGNGLDYFPAQMNISVSNVPPSGCSECSAVLSDLGPLFASKECPAISEEQVPQTPKTLQSDEVLVFPNPASSSVQVHLTGAVLENASCKLIDLAGQPVKSCDFQDAPSLTIDVDCLAAGYYIVLVRNGDSEYRFPIMVAH